MVHHRQRSANSRRVAGASAVVAAIAALLVVPATPAAAQEPVSFTGPTNYTAGNDPYSVAVGDFNGDGHPDLAVANTSSDNVSIFLGTAGGTFTGPTNFPVGNGPVSVAVGDFNSDGHPDLAVANYGSNNVSVLPNNSVPSNPCCQLPCHPQWWCWGWLPLSPSLELNWGPLHR